VDVVSRLKNVLPGRLCAAVWITLLAGCALTAAGPANPLSEAIGSLLALMSMYGYPVLLTFVSPLHVSPLSRRLSLVCSSVVAVLFVAGFITESSPGYEGNNAPAWSYPVGLATGIAIFVPFIVAARALRRLELSVGRDVPLGGASAFLWLFYWPVGTYFFHRRLRYALDRRSASSLSTPA
jgi:hypothetical protein